MSKQTQLIAVGIISLLVGVLLGGTFVGSNDNLREDLFGTAGIDNEDTSSAPPDTQARSVQMVYYEIELEQVDEWLSTSRPDADLATTTENISALETFITDAATASLTQDETEAKTSEVLENIIVGLAQDETSEAATIAANYNIKMCLGYEEDLYSMTGPISYIALELPKDQEQNLQLEGWELLTQPKSVFWSVIFCYDSENE